MSCHSRNVRTAALVNPSRNSLGSLQFSEEALLRGQRKLAGNALRQLAVVSYIDRCRDHFHG